MRAPIQCAASNETPLSRALQGIHVNLAQAGNRFARRARSYGSPGVIAGAGHARE